MSLNAGTLYVDVKPDTSAMTGKKAGSGLSSAMKTAGILAAGAFAVSFVKSAVGEAQEAEKVSKAFTDSLSRGTENFKADALMEQFDRINNNLNVSDEQLDTWAAHFNNAIDFTKFGDNAKDMLVKMTELVPNLAAASGKSVSMVEKTIKTIGTAPDASVTALRKLGAITDKQAEKATLMLKHGKTTEAQQYLVAKAYDATSGAAKAQQTASEKLSLVWAELQEKIGTALLPILNKLMNTGSKIVTWMTENAKVVGILTGALIALGVTMFVNAQRLKFMNEEGLIYNAWTKIAWVATKAWTAAQWAWNAAMTANPIGLIIAAIVVAIAVVVLLWKKNEGFRNFVLAAWEAIKDAAIATWNWIKAVALAVWDKIKGAVGGFVTALKAYFKISLAIVKTAWNVVKSVTLAVWHAISSAVSKTFAVIKGIVMTYVGFWRTTWGVVKSVAVGVFNGLKAVVQNWVSGIKTLIGGVKTAFSNIWNGVASVAKSAFNGIASAWNSTIGALSFSIPSWVPAIGGNSWAVPDMPMLAEGGIVNGPTIAMLGEAGREAVIPLDKGGMTVRITDSNLGLIMTGTLEDEKRYSEQRGRASR